MLTKEALLAQLAACGLPPEIWKAAELKKFCEEYAAGELLFDFERKIRVIHVVILHISADFRDSGKKIRYKLHEYRIKDGQRKLRFQHEGSASEKIRFVAGEEWRQAVLRCLIEELQLRHRRNQRRLIRLRDIPDLHLFPRSPYPDDGESSAKYPSSIRTHRLIYPVAFTMPADFRCREGYVEMEPDGETRKSEFIWRKVQQFRARIEDRAEVAALSPLDGYKNRQ